MQLQTVTEGAVGRRLTMSFARHGEEVREAQRLRYRIFVGEMGARLRSSTPGIDEDIYDPHCEHLLVRDETTGEVVGTYRILTAERASRIGGFYAEDEFDLSRFAAIRDRVVEVGRSCVHPDYRTGATISLLWGGLVNFMAKHPTYEYLMGCASIGMGDGGHVATSLYNRLSRANSCPIEYRAFPRCRLPLEGLNATLLAPVPPLIKGYLRLGCWICAEPAWDPDFNTADLLLLLPLANLDLRYARHFMRGNF